MTKANFDEQYFQLDAAAPHYAQTVREYLHQAFLHHWFGRQGSIEWPPRSPALISMDFFWGVFKNKVYERNPHIVIELKDYISDAFTEIDGDQNLCCTVCQSLLGRYEDCFKVEGGHVEHLRD